MGSNSDSDNRDGNVKAEGVAREREGGGGEGGEGGREKEGERERDVGLARIHCRDAIICLFCKRALYKRLCSAKETVGLQEFTVKMPQCV